MMILDCLMAVHFLCTTEIIIDYLLLVFKENKPCEPVSLFGQEKSSQITYLWWRDIKH